MLPNFIVIGAQKAGTSSLHHYLSFHPEIFMSEHKELNFFNEKLTWNKGLKWYESNFTSDAKIRGESSPHYTYYPSKAGVPQRMFSIIPNAKLIYVLRNPIERMISSYYDAYCGYNEHRTIEEALLDSKDNVYLDVSKYFMQLEQYLQYYSKENILIVLAEDLKKERQKVLKNVFQFLGVDDSFECEEFSSLINVSKEKIRRKKTKHFVRFLMGKNILVRTIRTVAPRFFQKEIDDFTNGKRIERPVLEQSVRDSLVLNFKDDVAKLQEFTGYNLDDWLH